MKKVIINADDFGLSTGINAAIIKAHREGVLTSATILANGPAFEDAVALAKQNPRLGVGVHLNLYRGFPLAGREKVPSLVSGSSGEFLQSLTKIFWRMAWGGFLPEEMYIELKAQIQRVLSAGITPTHLDSEKHLHHAPRVIPVVVRLAREMGIEKIRVVQESIRMTNGRKVLAGMVFARARRRFLSAGLTVPDYSCGFSYPMTSEALAGALASLPGGLTEIMCHPGLTGPEYRYNAESHGSFFVQRMREKELAALLDPRVKRFLANTEIAVGHYGTLEMMHS